MSSTATPPQRLKRPLIITLLGWMLIAVGALECISHAAATRRPVHTGDIALLLFELVILVSGVFLLRGSNWARWIALAWIGFHVGISFVNSVRAGLVHSAILVVFAWLLFQPDVNAWFRWRRAAQADQPSQMV
ncbi:MAG TPA: hypothetical protein VIY53_06530 [Acidobacteriaceae bacterium]